MEVEELVMKRIMSKKDRKQPQEITKTRKIIVVVSLQNKKQFPKELRKKPFCMNIFKKMQKRQKAKQRGKN